MAHVNFPTRTNKAYQYQDKLSLIEKPVSIVGLDFSFSFLIKASLWDCSSFGQDASTLSPLP
jgi:hypothetical protein